MYLGQLGVITYYDNAKFERNGFGQTNSIIFDLNIIEII